MSTPRTVLLKVFRYGLGDTAPRYDQFRVPAGPRTTVLDALLAVRRQQDPSLTVRHSCLHGSCGTCGMRVNGREVLACVTRLEELGDPVVVEPLAGAAVAGDLVVDMEHVYRRLEPVGRALVRASERAGTNDGKAGPGPVLEDLERFEDCIECGLCLSACPAAGDPRFLGLAALAAAERSWRSPTARTEGGARPGRRRSRPGAATRRSNARPSARPGSTRARRSCGCVAAARTGCPGWSAATTGRSSHDPGHPPRRETTTATAALARSARAAPGHLGVRGQPAHRARAGRLPVPAPGDPQHLLRGPEAWDGLVDLFRQPVFLAFDLLLVAGLAFHGLNGLRVALVGSGLLVDRHRALLVAAAILVGLVVVVAAVRILA